MPVLGLGRGESITQGARVTVSRRGCTQGKGSSSTPGSTALCWGSGTDMGQGKWYKNLPFVESEYGSRGLTLGGEIYYMLYRFSVLQLERKLQCK